MFPVKPFQMLHKVHKPRRTSKVRLETGGKGKLSTPMNQPDRKYRGNKR